MSVRTNLDEGEGEECRDVSRVRGTFTSDIATGFVVFKDGREFLFGPGDSPRWSLSLTRVRHGSGQEKSSTIECELMFMDEQDRRIVVRQTDAVDNVTYRLAFTENDGPTFYGMFSGTTTFPGEEQPTELLCAAFYRKKQPTTETGSET